MTTAEDTLVRIACQRGLLPRGTGWPAHATERTALGRALAREFDLTWVELGDQPVARDILEALPRTFVLEHGVIPFARERGVLQVAVSDPLALDLMDSLAFVAGSPVRTVLAAAADIRQALDRAYGWDLAEADGLRAPETVATTAAGSSDERDAPAPMLPSTV